MYKINQVTLPIGFKKEDLPDILSKKIKIPKDKIIHVELFRLSIDAREKNNLCYKAGIVFDLNLKFDYKKYKNIEIYEKQDNKVKIWTNPIKPKILIVGSGPCGLFAGLRLAESGAKVTIIERGYEMSKRKIAVEKMMKDGILDPVSNIQYGEGGAGTFSDGKLNTGIKSKYISTVLETFYKFGAKENILYDARPHIGTDILSKVIVNMRKYLIDLNVDILFEHKLEEIDVKDNGSKTVKISTPNGTVCWDYDIVLLAIGHSSRDTIRMLYGKNMNFRQKPFSLGYRIEHLQKDINMAQYGDNDNARSLPPADYHLVEHVGDRVVYSFCMCPGGVVVPATSEKDAVVTNGMSYSDRDGVNSNSALLVSVATSDFPSEHELSGIDMQEYFERYAFSKTDKFKAIVQRVGDFLNGVPSKDFGKVKSTYKPGVVLGSVEDMMPSFVVSSIKTAIPLLAKKLKGFDDPDALLVGVETRSSAPYQILRGADMQTNIDNVFAIGEGAGWSGGIVSSAVEGIKCADIIIDKYN